MASIMFILNAIFFGYIWLDVIIYNFLMIVVNVAYSIPLLKKYFDIKLNPLEQQVYENVFIKNIDKRTCKRILDSGIIRPVNSGNFVVQAKEKY